MSTPIATGQSGIALVETDAPEFFVSGLARVEPLGANARFVYFGDYMHERRVILSVIVPVEAIGPAIELTMVTLGDSLGAPVTPYGGRQLTS
jgi:hypothetical protein